MSEPVTSVETRGDGGAGGAEEDELVELADDFLRRHRAGEHPSVDDYAREHPGLAGRIRDLFAAMIEMERPGTGFGATWDPAPPAERVGATIGRYKLLERIGEGGMGTVFLAEQTHPVRRTVALKVIKAGMDTGQVIARFEAERQALAMMDHPNIAKVLDAGATDSGRPYFVMELVPGVPITDYCDRNKPPTRERLKLFVQVCHAVQHAHAKGIIHRDLKPTNVLVMVRDDKPVPKVIDFGVAKAAGEPLTERTRFTQFAQMVGTPLYMSPEQAQMGGMDVDTRSDVYSLGVLLYELLTGSTPFDRRRLGAAEMDEVRRIIREEEPPRPSLRLGSAATAEAWAAVGQGPELRRLSGLVRGELDWIVMKALEKDRGRRYQTVNGLARDVERYLADEAVQACPPSTSYRLRKLLRRHKGPVIAASLVALALAGGMVGTVAGLVRAHAAQSRAVDEARQKEEALKGKEAALVVAQQSERAKAEQLWEALVAQAKANRLSRRAGQRFETLTILKRATEMARALNLPSEKRDELRHVATAALALPDFNLAGPWNTWPADNLEFDFDESHTLYARTDRLGNCSVRRVADDRELYRMPGRGERSWPAFSRDGKFVTLLFNKFARQDVSLELWQLDENGSRRLLSEEGARSVSLRDSKLLVAGYLDGTISAFELPSGRRVSQLSPDTHTGELEVALHPTEPVVAVGSYHTPVLQLRDLMSGSVIRSTPLPCGPTSVAWHPDGQRLAVGLADLRLVHLYDRATLTPYRNLHVDHFGSLVAFNPGGDRLITTGWGAVIHLFDLNTGEMLWTSPPTPSSRRFSADGTTMAGGILDGKLGTWQVADGREFQTLRFAALPDKGEYFKAAVSPDGRLLAASVTDGVVIWSFATGSQLAFIPLGRRDNCVVFEPAGSLLTLTNTEGLKRWSLTRDAKAPDRITIAGPESLPVPQGSWLSRSGDGSVIVSCSRSVASQFPHAGGWILRAERPGEPIRIDPGVDMARIEVSPDGERVLTWEHNTGETKIWDARDGRLIKSLGERAVEAAPGFSPDGQWIGGMGGGRLIAADTWEPGPRVPAGAVFAPNGTLMAFATPLGIRVIDRVTSRELAMLEDPDLAIIWQTFFSPDGTKLVALTRNNGVRVWDLRLVRKHLKAMDLDWDWPEFPAESDAAALPGGLTGIRP